MSLRRALRSDRGFGVFWLGFSASVLGDAITRTTLIWYVFDLTGSPVSLGWLSFCFTAPVVVGGTLSARRMSCKAEMVGRFPAQLPRRLSR
jgi:acyl dehydratase